MSFSSEIKEELSRKISSARHCQLAEIAAMTAMCADFVETVDSTYLLHFSTENESVARKYFTLLEKTFNINAVDSEYDIEKMKKGITYAADITDSELVLNIMKALKLEKNGHYEPCEQLIHTILIQQNCCKRTFIRGAFLAAGSISDPNKFYHFEIVCDTMEKASQLSTVINQFDIDSKIIQRKKYYVVYIKEGTNIADILNVMEAHLALMDFENVRIMKEMRNSVNRQVNCETANINKTVGAAVKQIRDIEYIRDTCGLDSLKDSLHEVALARLENPEMNLKELGNLLTVSVSKSGVNHRLRKISEIAESIRSNRED